MTKTSHPFPATALAGLATLAALLVAGCNSSVTEPAPFAPAAADTAFNLFALKGGVQPDTVVELRADTGVASIRPRAYYDLDAKTSLAATGDTSGWDISFLSTGLRVRGEYRLLSGVLFDSVKVAPDSGYSAAGAVSSPWYNYNGATFTITPKDSTVLILKTSAGKYAKIQILNYYKHAPVSPAGLTDTARYYTFRSFVQKDGSRNLTPDAAPFTYFSLRTGAEVSDTSTGWDIAFRSTTVKVNGTAQLLGGVDFDTLATAPVAGYGPGATQRTWYDYSGEPNHTITPKLATVLALKTLDGKYAKLQILSYYQGFPVAPNGNVNTSRYYTFRWFLQADGTTRLK